MGIKRLIPESVAKEKIIDKLHRQLARDNVMNRNTTSLIAKIKQFENS